jgi:hypothetical protein
MTALRQSVEKRIRYGNRKKTSSTTRTLEERNRGQGREGRGRDNGLKREGKDLAGSEHCFLVPTPSSHTTEMM